METLVEKFTPIVWIHPEEKYYPCSIDWLLKNSTLIDFNDGLKIAAPTQRDLYNIAEKYGFQRRADGDVILCYSSELYRGESPLSNVPCYAIVRESDTHIYITYIFLFAYNGEYLVAGLAKAGFHPGDLEHITVEVEKQTGALSRVMFSAHGTKDGRWVDANEIELMDGKIVAYMAINGHGLYPHEGTVFRLGGVANDYLGKGKLWQPRVDIFYPRSSPNFNIDTMGWTVYNSRIGGSCDKPNTDGITGLADKAWIQTIDNLDEMAYAPPRILNITQSNVLSTSQDLASFFIVYFITFLVLTFATNVVYKSNIKSPFKFKYHLIALVLAFVVLRMFRSGLSAIVEKIAAKFG